MGVWKSFCFLLTLFVTSKTINCTIFTPMCTDNAMDHLRCHEPSNFKCGYSTSLHVLRSLITVWSNTGKPALSQPISSTKDWSCWSCPTGTCHLPPKLDGGSELLQSSGVSSGVFAPLRWPLRTLENGLWI